MSKENNTQLRNQIKALSEINTQLREQLSAMALRYREAYVPYKIYQELFIKEFAGKNKDAKIFYYTFLAIRNMKTKDLKKNSIVKKSLFDCFIKNNIYKETELRDRQYSKGKPAYTYTEKMIELYRTYYEHWRKKLIAIRKDYFCLYDKYSKNIPMYDPLEPMP